MLLKESLRIRSGVRINSPVPDGTSIFEMIVSFFREMRRRTAVVCSRALHHATEVTLEPECAQCEHRGRIYISIRSLLCWLESAKSRLMPLRVNGD